MNGKMLLYAGIMMLGVLVSALSQVALKKAALREYPSRIREYLNPLVIGAYVAFFAATVCTMIAYKVIPLSLGPIIESTSYIYVTIFGYLFFREKITKRKVIALIVIVAGIVVYSLG